MSRCQGWLITGSMVSLLLSACGGGGSADNPPPPPPPTAVQFIAPTDNVFVAAVDPNNPGTVFGPTQGTYAGARLLITATLKLGSPTTQNQVDYAQIYKANDGHLYRVNLLTTGDPMPEQVSSESHATTDDLCSLNGANTSLGTDVNYVAEQSYNDFANPENSVYFYRLPGPNGSCNTSQDIVYMAKLGMAPTDAPILALMPMAVLHDPTSGAITGFIVNEGTALTSYDQNFQNRSVLYTPATPISVAYSLASAGVGSTTNPGGLFVLDGSIVYIDYTRLTVSGSLFTVPNWNPAKRFASSANGSTVYFAVNTSNTAQTPVIPTSALYSMPLDGSAAPTALATENGAIAQVTVAIYGTTVAWSIVPPGGQYTIRTLAQGGAQPVTAFTAAGTSGSFVVTADDIYYTASTLAFPASHTVVYSNTQTGIIAMDGTVIEPAVANSRFVAEERDNNGSDWTDIVRARNLTPVTLVDAANGNTYTEDGISGATLEVVDTSTNSVTLTLGTLPAGTIMQGNGTLIASAGYMDGINVNSTSDPGTRELIYFDTSKANSLALLTNNLH
jgi:hypothetical protein